MILNSKFDYILSWNNSIRLKVNKQVSVYALKPLISGRVGSGGGGGGGGVGGREGSSLGLALI